MRTASTFLRFLLALCFFFAAFWALRLAWADHLFRSGHFDQAAKLVPFHHRYQARAGNLRRAVELNPYFSSAWLELSFNAEAAGDLPEAERCLLQANRVDRMFDVRWAAANFYFRRQNWPEFWKWIRLAAERSYGDRSALFRLAWHASQDPAEILSKAIPPAVPGLVSAYVQFLLAESRLEPAFHAGLATLPQAAADDIPALMNLCEKLLEAGQGQPALAIWNGLIEHRWLPYTPVDPAKSRYLTNPTLALEPSGKGFDWRLLWRAGIHGSWARHQKQLRVELSGRQAERTDLIGLYAPFMKAGRYRLHFASRLEDIPANSGIAWHALDPSGVELPSRSPAPDCFEFDVPRDAMLVYLRLDYRRASGTVRPTGTFILEGGVRLEPVL